jgi:hypothetical protein
MASPNGTILNLDTTIFSGFLPDKKGLLWAEILNAFWDLGLVESDTKLHKYNVYHQYFIIELDAWRFCSSNVSLETYRDLVNLVKHLKENKGAPRNSPQILAFFGSATMDPKYDSAIFLAVRLWLMINVGSPNLQRVFPGKSNIIWSPDSSINSLLETQFPHHPTMLSAPQLPRNLNVYELERVAGLDVVWTDHLTDHLQLDLDLNRINIYHHVSVLKCQEHDQGPQ